MEESGFDRIRSSLQPTNVAPQGRWHSIDVLPPPGLPTIHWYDQINPLWWLQNIDEPVPPEWYKPDDKRRVLKYRWRNPFHNFNSYVIGIADKEFVRSGRYPARISNPRGGWNFAVSKYRCLRLPFLSYRRHKIDFYFGWRERGNFGIKLNFK